MVEVGQARQNRYAAHWTRMLRKEEKIPTEYQDGAYSYQKMRHFINDIYNRRRIYLAPGCS